MVIRPTKNNWLKSLPFLPKKKKTEIGETCQKLIFSLNYGYPWLNYLDIKLNQVIPVSKEAG